MDFDHAIAAHSSWKQKLRSYLAKPDHSLKAADVERSDKCDLGKWIVEETTRYGKMPEFQTLRSAHERFHKAAAGVIRHVDSGQNVTEEVALGGKSEFSSASSSVVSAIMAIKAKAGKQVLVTK
ncbi:MAG: CZB domain-containing protein [Acidobacteriia bacterium]|nr:CZB domain-containing protein [Terriglobia bacterium]